MYYFIYMDDDSLPEVYCVDKSRNAWRTFESFLSSLPPVAVSDTDYWKYVNMILKMRKDSGCKYSGLQGRWNGLRHDVQCISLQGSQVCTGAHSTLLEQV